MGGLKWKFNTGSKLNFIGGNFLDQDHVVLSDGQFTLWSARYMIVVYNNENNQNNKNTRLEADSVFWHYYWGFQCSVK